MRLIQSSKLKKFSIIGLFGKRDVVLEFETNVKIVVGENGIGKTTILNALNYALSCNFRRLSAIEFDVIKLEFSGGIPIEIKRQDLLTQNTREHNPYFSNIRHLLSERDYMFFRNLIKEGRYGEAEELMVRRMGWSMRRVREVMDEIVSGYRYHDARNEHSKVLKTIKDEIQSHIKEEILYFPTYRRIEEDLKNLGCTIGRSEEDNTLIQFGMDDVVKRFDFITQTIKDSAIEWFSKVTGEMLSQLVDGIRVTEEMKESIKQQDALRIVLDRVGSNLTEEYKKNIYNLIQSGEIYEEKYDPLIYFLSNLIKIYDQQRERDNSIKQFAAVCNKYLYGKSVDYNESAVRIDIIQPRYNNEPIELSKLSSGEKQIVSLFSKIYLSSEKDFIILFDEPELSLSLEWQQQLLPDILHSGRCSLLFAVTHSPFIFENELDEFTEDLSLHIKEGKRRGRK